MGHIAALSCAGAEVANAVVRATALTKARGFISGTPLVRCLHLCDAITGTLEDHFYFDMWKLKCNCEQNVLNSGSDYAAGTDILDREINQGADFAWQDPPLQINSAHADRFCLVAFHKLYESSACEVITHREMGYVGDA